jgi:hypothetical protein
MKLENISFANNDEITTFLTQYIPLRIHFLDSKDMHTINEILGEFWNQCCPESQSEIEETFAQLVDAGEIPVFSSGQNPERQPLYALRLPTLH